MKLKKIILLSAIISLIAISDEIKAQNWKYWNKVDGVAIFYAFTPARGNSYPYYQVRFVNGNQGSKLIYADFYFERKDKKLRQIWFSYNDAKWIVRLKNGGVYTSGKHYVNLNIQNWSKQGGGGMKIPNLRYQNFLVRNP